MATTRPRERILAAATLLFADEGIHATTVDRVSAERDYMRLHVGKRSWLINHTIGRLEAELDPARFVRLHRSAIVRRDFVTGLRRDDGGRWYARLADGEEQKRERRFPHGRS